jgi:hypothetical protein
MRSLAIAFALVALPAWSQVYRWVDERGVVNYSNEPPPRGVQASKVDVAPKKGPPISIERVAEARKARGLEYRKYLALRRGFTEAEVLNVAGDPDVVRWDSKFSKTFTYLPTEAEPFTTTVTLVRGRVEDIERLAR